MHALKVIGYGHVSINLEQSLFNRHNDLVKNNSLTKIKFYNSLIFKFLSFDHTSTQFFATRNETASNKVLMWIEPEIFEELKKLSSKKHVTLRSICYTALIEHLKNEEKEVA